MRRDGALLQWQYDYLPQAYFDELKTLFCDLVLQKLLDILKPLV